MAGAPDSDWAVHGNHVHRKSGKRARMEPEFSMMQERGKISVAGHEKRMR